jgi:RCR-type E3 ubiquitin transferase
LNYVTIIINLRFVLVLLCSGGFALFGGRGDYTAKIKLFDIGSEGGDQEADGELMAESEEIVYECAPRDRFPILFDVPLPLVVRH